MIVVRKFFGLFRKEINGLHEAAFLLGVFALMSQIMAVVRDRLFAAEFGAGVELDIYYAAFRIPDLIFVSIASFVAITVIMPFLIDKLEKDKKEAQRFMSGLFSVFFVTIVFVCVVVYIAIPKLVSGSLGFGIEEQKQVIMLSRILLLSPIFLGISNIFACITQAHKNFLVYSLSPVLYNLGIISGLLFFYPTFGTAGLAYGVVFGAILHAAVQVPIVIHHGLFPRFSFSITFSEIKQIVSLALPRTLGLSSQQIAFFVLTAIASSMTVGSVAVLQFAFNLQSVPLSIIGVSYSVAAFPTLARLYSKNEKEKFTEQVLTALRHIIFWSLPILFLFIVLRAQIVRSILGVGEFNWDNTKLTAAALAIFSVSVVAQSILLLLVRGYYAAGKTRVPVLVNIVSAFLTIVFAYVFTSLFSTPLPFVKDFLESFLRVTGVKEEGSVMLALPLAYSVGSILNVLILWKVFKRDFHIGRCEILQKTFRHSLYGAVSMGTVAYILLNIFDDKMLDLDTFVGIFSQGLLSGLGGILAGILILKIIQNEEIEEIQKALRRKFWKSRAILPDKTDLS